MYQELSRKELQTLCKQQGIPANKSNAFMAQSLAALASVSFLIFFSWVLYFSFRGRRERGGVVGERERERGSVCVCGTYCTSLECRVSAIPSRCLHCSPTASTFDSFGNCSYPCGDAKTAESFKCEGEEGDRHDRHLSGETHPVERKHHIFFFFSKLEADQKIQSRGWSAIWVFAPISKRASYRG